jgi:hypothetical protein
MTQYSWTTRPETVEMQITTFCERLQALLGANLVGIYLHGSLD